MARPFDLGAGCQAYTLLTLAPLVHVNIGAPLVIIVKQRTCLPILGQDLCRLFCSIKLVRRTLAGKSVFPILKYLLLCFFHFFFISSMFSMDCQNVIQSNMPAQL
jgi:hypothetical protein